MISIVVKLLAVAALIRAEGNPLRRIIGGSEIEIGAAPYTVAIYDYNTVKICTGAILTEKFIATAAHCSTTPLNITIHAGSTYILDGVVGQMIKAKKFITHPLYKKLNIATYNDYGLIVLEKPLVFNENVSAIPMGQGSLPLGTMMLATEWGQFREGYHYLDPKLKAVELPIIAYEVCKTLFKQEYHDSILCAGTFNKGESVYNGYSGGPLVFNNTLYGLTSFVYDIKAPFYPSGFARISYGYNWYVRTMKENISI